MLEGARFIKELYDNDEFKPILIEGDHGYGKSTYANRLVAEVYSGNNKANWSFENKTRLDGTIYEYALFPYHLGFHPKHVLDLWIKKKGSIKYRDHVFHWDDAGLWLHSLDFQDPFVKEVGKYMQVVRSDWAAMIFTAISREDISSKVRGLRNAIMVEISKMGKDKTHPNRRTATAYILRKGWKGREWKDYQWEEYFDSHAPGIYEVDNKGNVLKQEGFYGWYKPLRDDYSELAKRRMEKKLKEHPDLFSDDMVI